MSLKVGFVPSWDQDWPVFEFALTHAIWTPVIFHFWSVLGSEFFPAVSGTYKISMKMFQIHQRTVWQDSQNFLGLPTHSFAHAKVYKSNLNPKILEFVGDTSVSVLF